MKKTKIICTMGPSTDDPGLLLDMIRAGMDLARFNFSHGDHASHKQRLAMVRSAAGKAGKPVATICDTKGPEMRLGLFEGGRAVLENGKEFVLTTEPVKGTAAVASVNYGGLPEEVRPGNRILLADGMLILEVTKIEGPRICTVVRSGGEISDRKRVACPGVELKMPFLSGQDEDDILFAAENGMDYVAASFVQNADNVFVKIPAVLALILYIVDREQALDIVIPAVVRIEKIIVNGYKRCLPVVAVDYIRLEVYVRQHFKARSREERKTLRVIIEAIKTVTLEVVFIVDEIVENAVIASLENAAVLVAPRYRNGKARYVVHRVAKALRDIAVKRHYNAAANHSLAESLRQRACNISQSARCSKGLCFTCAK